MKPGETGSTDTTTQATATTPALATEPVRAGNAAFGAPEERKAPGPTWQERMAEARKLVAEGKDPVEAFQPKAETPAPETPAAEAAPAGEPAAEPEPAEPPVEAPEGTTWDAKAGRFRSTATGNFVKVSEQGAVEGEEEGTAEAAETPTGTDGAPTEQPEGAEPDESLIVRLRGRRPEDPESEIVVPDAEVAERLRQGINDGMRRDEFKRQMKQVEEQREELDSIHDYLASDPVNFIMDQVTNTEVRRDLALNLLSDPEVYDHVVQKFADVGEDPTALKALQLELKDQRRTNRDTSQKTIEFNRAVSKNVREVTQTVGALAEGMDAAREERFVRLAMRELAEYTKDPKNGYVNDKGEIVALLDPADVTAVLESIGTLELFGVKPGTSTAPTGGSTSMKPAAAAPQSSAAAPRSSAPLPTARPKGPAEEKIAQQASSTTPAAGQRLAASHARRVAASAVAPAGTGPAPSTLQPPPEVRKDVRKMIAWQRANGS